MLKQVSLLEAFKWRHSVRNYTGQFSEDQQKVVKEIVENANHSIVPFGHSDSKIEISDNTKITTYGFVKNYSGWIFEAVPNKYKTSKTPLINGRDEMYYATLDSAFRAQLAVMNLAKYHIGTVWLAGSYGESALEKLVPGHTVPAGIPYGNPKDGLHFVERLIKKSAKSNKRKEISQLFYDVENKRPFTNENAKELTNFIEAIRSGPSAVNAQPWRFCIDGRKIHFFSVGKDKYPRHDLGIAMANVALLSKEVLNHEPKFYLEGSVPPALIGGKYVGSCIFRD